MKTKIEYKHCKTVSEFLAIDWTPGYMGAQLVENPVRETEKAFGFKAKKFNSYGNAYDGVAWIAKSMLIPVRNDHYTAPDAGPVMWICPMWLWEKHFSE